MQHWQSAPACKCCVVVFKRESALHQPLKAFQNLFCHSSSAPGIYRPRRMSRLIQHCTSKAIWKTNDGFSEWSDCRPEYCAANEQSLFRFKLSRNPDQGSISFYCLSGSGLLKATQAPIKRFHQPLEEAKARPFYSTTRPAIVRVYPCDFAVLRQPSCSHAWSRVLMCVCLQSRALQPLLKKFVLHFEGSQDLLQEIEAQLEAEFMRKYFICMFASCISCNPSHAHVLPPSNAAAANRPSLAKPFSHSTLLTLTTFSSVLQSAMRRKQMPPSPSSFVTVSF